uniref:Uncharacterized protein n=1 Tax=Ascaris lumbricoides TaxID=6252 RepID=A0A0M3IXC2_ASCLU
MEFVNSPASQKSGAAFCEGDEEEGDETAVVPALRFFFLGVDLKDNYCGRVKDRMNDDLQALW